MLSEKYRPVVFDGIIGQSAVVRTMKWHLSKEYPDGQCFLITGPSGCGKTTMAECAARHWGCSDLDIHTIQSTECDVAELRTLAGNMAIYGWKNSRKCYVIDEVHTVTGTAQKRLLSLLEHVPRHVLIVGTTTEDNWTDGTLLSRWVRFQLQKVPATEVAQHIETIAEAECLPIPTDPQWAAKWIKYAGLNIRDLLNQLPGRLLGMESEVAA